MIELCRREGIVQSLYYRWSKEFLEAGKKRPGVLPRARDPNHLGGMADPERLRGADRLAHIARR